MFTKQSLMTDLEKLGVDPKGTLMVHISCKAVGDVEGKGDTVLDALISYMASGLFVLPSHTWHNVNKQNPIMDVLYTPTCVGILTELFRKYKNVHRSLHPTHSLAAIGADAESFISGEEYMQTPCGKEGAYYKLWVRDAQILLIGVNFSCNTYIHGIEEWDGAAGTISQEKTDLYVINSDSKRLYTPQYRHCATNGSNTFTKLEPEAVQKGILKIGRFGKASARLMNAAPLRSLTAAHLKEDADYLNFY